MTSPSSTPAFASANQLFTAAVVQVLHDGAAVAPRGLATRESLGATMRLASPRHRLVDAPPFRVLNPAFAAAEALWILSGSDGEWIHEFNASLARFIGGGTPHGAYGPRLRAWDGWIDQLDRVRTLLLTDPDSRRAAVQIFDPGRDLSDRRDIPCTLGHRFYLRDGRLHLHTSMRSQDVWLGLPYDVFTATVLLELMAGWLGAGLGTYYHQVDSLHLYAEHQDAASRVTGGPVEEMAPLTVAWGDFDPLVGQVIAGEPVGAPGWDDFAAVLASYRLWKVGKRDEALDLASGPGVLRQALARWYVRLEQAARAGVPQPAGR